MKKCVYAVMGLAVIAIIVGCGTDKPSQGSAPMSYVSEHSTAVVTIDVGGIMAEESIQQYLDEPMAELAQEIDTAVFSPYDVGQVVIFTTEDLASMGMMGPQELTIAVSFKKRMPLSLVDSLTDFTLEKRTAEGGETYLANDAQEVYMCAPADDIWLVSPSESIIAQMATGEMPQPDEVDAKSAAPALMKEMTAEAGCMAALSFDISQSERPDLGPMAEMLAKDTTNPELAQLAAMAPALQQAISTINSAGFSIGRQEDNFALSAQMRFADQETAEEIRKAMVMMLGFAGGEATKQELGFAKDIIDRVKIGATGQTVSVSVTISDADIVKAQQAIGGI